MIRVEPVVDDTMADSLDRIVVVEQELQWLFLVLVVDRMVVLGPLVDHNFVVKQVAHMLAVE
jgi:hypothetical protein